MNELALFAGGGGGLLGGLLLGWRSVCYVERDKYCVEVLKSRIKDGYLHDAPIWDDVRTFDGKPWAGCVDIVSAGFPCQPFSVAGKQAGEDDERNMWPETIRIIREVGPRFCLLENVPGLISNGYFATILGDLAESGFDARWDVFSAAGVGAPHLRKRLWIVGGNLSNSDSNGWHERRPKCERQQRQVAPVSDSGDVANAQHGRLSERWRTSNAGQDDERGGGSPNGGPSSGDKAKVSVANPNRSRQSGRDDERATQTETSPEEGGETTQRNGWWEAEPEVGRVVDGMAGRVGQLRALGNGQIPAVVVRAWNELTKTWKGIA